MPKPVILKNLYRNGNKVPMMFRNGEVIYRMLTKLVFSVDTDSVSFPQTGGGRTITITANDNWTMTIPNWITASALSGTTGATITLTAQAAQSTQEGNIVISCGGKTHTIAASQSTGLPDKSFVFNYNAKNFDQSTFTIANESDGTLQQDMVWSATTSTVRNNIVLSDDHISVPMSAFSRFDFSSTGANPMNITDAAPSLTMLMKVRVTGAETSAGQSAPMTGDASYNIFCTRDNSNYNLMWRTNNKSWIICGGAGYDASPNSVPVATATTITLLLRINNKQVEIKNLTAGTSNTPFTPTFNQPTSLFSFFASFYNSGNPLKEKTTGDFYWTYASREVLTDDEVQQVVHYNDNL